MEMGKSGSGYASAVILDGREWRPAGLPSSGRETPGVLKIAVESADMVRATFHPASANVQQAVVIHVAQLGFGINSHIKAGENNGRKLQHDFVVLSLASEQLHNESSEVVFHLNNSKLAGNLPGAVAAWITENDRADPIQAVCGWLR